MFQSRHKFLIVFLFSCVILFKRIENDGLLELCCRRWCFWNILLAAFVICCGSFLSLSSAPSYVNPWKTPPHPRTPHLPPRPGLVFGVGLKESEAEQRRGEERNAPVGLRLPLISTCETNELNYEQLCLFSSLPSVCGDSPPHQKRKERRLVFVSLIRWDSLKSAPGLSLLPCHHAWSPEMKWILLRGLLL